jgi:hypothetical protein
VEDVDDDDTSFDATTKYDTDETDEEPMED